MNKYCKICIYYIIVSVTEQCCSKHMPKHGKRHGKRHDRCQQLWRYWQRGESRRWNLKPSQAWLIRLWSGCFGCHVQGEYYLYCCQWGPLGISFHSLALELTAFTHGSFSLFWPRRSSHVRAWRSGLVLVWVPERQVLVWEFRKFAIKLAAI
jgi:hypothetical protein